MSTPKQESKSPIDEVLERIERETRELRKRFDELVKAMEEDRKRLIESASGKK